MPGEDYEFHYRKHLTSVYLQMHISAHARNLADKRSSPRPHPPCTLHVPIVLRLQRIPPSFFSDAKRPHVYNLAVKKIIMADTVFNPKLGHTFPTTLTETYPVHIGLLRSSVTILHRIRGVCQRRCVRLIFNATSTVSMISFGQVGPFQGSRYPFPRGPFLSSTPTE